MKKELNGRGNEWIMMSFFYQKGNASMMMIHDCGVYSYLIIYREDKSIKF